MKYASTLAMLSMAGFIASAQAADCSRDDIDHYLDRGFTPKQVLELCRTGGADSSLEQATKNSQQLDGLRDTLQARNINLDAGYLSFERDLCVKYDRPDFAQQRKKACGTASFRLARQGLKVLDSRQKLLFWGVNEVLVSSPQVERDYRLNQDELSERNQRRLQKALPAGDEVSLPVRDGVAISQLQQLLEELAMPD